MRRRPLPFALALLAALLASAPAAAVVPFYVAGKLGIASAGAELGDVDRVLDGEDNYWSLAFGARLGRFVSIQVETHELGRFSGTSAPCPIGAAPCAGAPVPVRARAGGYSVSILPRYPLTTGLGLYGKLGQIAWDADFEVFVDDPFSDSFDDTELLAGVGLDWRLPGPVHVFVEYERFGDSFEAISVGASFEF